MTPRFVLLKGILLISAVGLAAGFIPTTARLVAADVLLSNEGRSFTHGDMTRAAILRVAADVLVANPNPDNPDSASDIQQLENQDSLSVSCLIDAYYGTSLNLATTRARQKLQLERAIDDINDYQARTDTDEEDVAAAHFDSEQFADAQQRLVDFREIITMEISRGDYESARRFMGRLLHTLQDFYSHSNWIEIANGRGETNPSPNLDLGVRGKSVGNTAGPSTRTCRDCTHTGDVILDLVIGVLPFIGSTSCYDDCVDNIIADDGVITSGYADGGRDAQNNRIPKPDGKCSHGGLIDGTQDSPARGGINKDSTHEKLSPHFALHGLAATTAREHSYVMFSNIREDVNNDEQFSEFLGLEVEVSRVVSFAVAIDTTITEETHQAIVELIRQIVADIDQYIRTSENDLIVRYIVVPFDNSAVGDVYETGDLDQFQSTIAGLSLQNGGASSFVPAVEAVLAAGGASEPDSSIFVFTNMPPSDDNLLGQAEAITAQRNLKVFFVDDIPPMGKRSVADSIQLHHNLRHRRIIGISPVYTELETFSGGGIVSVPTAEIPNLAAFVSFSAIESDSVLYRIEAPMTNTHSFLVDSYTFEVLIFVNGRLITVSAVRTPQSANATLLTQYTQYANSDTLFIAAITIENNSTLFGRWEIDVESQGSYHIQILGDGELTFSTDLITTHPNTTDDINDLKPLEGLNMSAELIIVGSAMPVNITTLNIINEQRVLQTVPILNSTSGSFVAMFMPPLAEFKLQVMGVDDRGFDFSYISDVAVEPTSISLSFGPIDNGYLTLRPGTEADVTIVLLNDGASERYRITVNLDTSFDVDSSAVQYTIDNDRPFVSQNSQPNITINVMLSRNAPVGLSVTFTVVAQSENDFDENDFITFDVVTIRELSSSSATSIVYKSQVKMNLFMTMIVLLLLLSLVWG